MSAFTFSCPSCGQHLSADSNSAGAQITCPACRKPIVIPAPEPAVAMAGLRLAPSALGPIAPPPPGPGLQQPLQGASQRTSGLAVASLVCSIGSFLFIPFGFIPAIICGHMATKRIRREPGLGGRGLAKAGLIIGYISMSLFVLVIIGVAVFFIFAGRQFMDEFNRQMSQQQHQTPGARPSVVGRPTAPQPEAEPTDTTPDPVGWNLNLNGVEIPTAPLSGRIHGQAFKMDRIAYQGGFLKFQQGSGFMADLEMDAVLFVAVTQLPGKTFNFNADKAFGMRPHIYMQWKEGTNNRSQKSWINNYALRLEFGQVQNGKIPGKIYLCVPDAEKSFIRGTFELPAGG